MNRFKALPLYLSILLTFCYFGESLSQITLPTNPAAESRKDIYHIAPPSWYLGFKDSSLEIILNAENIDLYEITLNNYSGVTFKGKQNSANRHICYLSLSISPKTQPGVLVFNAIAPNPNEPQSRYARSFSFNFELKNKAITPFSPITPADVTYLILPDRFCNGDKDNDNAAMQFNEPVDRSAPKGRHGGDLAGIKSKIHYLKDLGITALWLNPVQENDQSKESFHGYAVTDHYKIDPRLGSNAEYVALSQELKKHSMKLIMDIIPNHVGDNHWMYKNYDTNWFNFRDTFYQTNFKASVSMDPYASNAERMKLTDGAFVKTMPDLNQHNPHIRKYLDQVYLWWIEYAGLAGYRIDTYPYPDQDYMNHLCEMLESEYPKFTIYGEVWTNNSFNQVAYAKNNIKGFEKNQLPGVTDFMLMWAMQEAGNKPFGWTDGLNKVYATLVEDYLYQDPSKNCTFLDNHDLSRIFSVVNEDINSWKRAMMLLFTLRGLPCIYYGTEILMTGTTKESDANVRFDFPGGWSSDKINKFKPDDRSSKEQAAYTYIKTLAKLRASNKAISEGKMTQFSGQDGIYCYFKQHGTSTVMCIYSQNIENSTVELSRYSEFLSTHSKLKNLITGEISPIEKTLNIEGQGSMIFELIK